MATDPQEGPIPGEQPPVGRPDATNLTQPAIASPGGAADEMIWVGRTHWQHFSARVALGAAILVATWIGIALIARQEWVTGATGLLVSLITLAVIILAVGGSILLEILRCRYRLSGQRLFIERGILSQTIDQTELIRVDDVRVHKRLLDRIFGLGTVEILSTDATDKSILIEGVKGPDQLAEQVRQRMRALRGRSLFVESL